MLPREILSLYDQQMRHHPPLDPGAVVEEADRVVRIIGPSNYIIFSDLDSDTVAAAVASQTAAFRGMNVDVEWKVYGHDRPRDLPERLRAAGYSPDPPETLMVFDLTESLPEGPKHSELEIRRAMDGSTLRAAIEASEGAFGSGEGWGGQDWFARLADPSFAAFVAFRNGKPVASARLEMPEGRVFAGLWGGGTIPGHRGLGIYRRLVAVRAELAKSRGYRFLTVDARASSRPILERMGFIALDTTQGWVLRSHATS